MDEELDVQLLTEAKLSFIREEVAKNQAFHDECANVLREQSNKLLASTFLAASALVGFGAAAQEVRRADEVAALATGIYLVFCALYLVGTVMRAEDAQALGNEPSALLRNEWLVYEDSAFVAGELLAKQNEITKQRLKNKEKGISLNRVICAALCSPFVFLVTQVIVA